MIQVYRNNTPHITLPLTREAVFSHALMSEDKVIYPIETPTLPDIQIGDYIIIDGVRYKINTLPNYGTVEHSQKYNHEFVFEAPIYTLYDKVFMFDDESDFPFFGTPLEHLQLVIDRINEIDAGWTIGTVDDMDAKNITYTDVKCRVALTMIAEAFGLEWHARGKVIDLVKQVGVDRDITVSHGKGNGLYNLSRTYVQDKNIVTRVFGKGGTRNLPEGYTKSRLSLSPLEANIDLYGVKEGIYTNDDIFPTREGVVTAVGAFDAESNFNTLQDVDLDFDINDYLASGLTAKIGFQTGELAGWEFEITKYDHAGKTIAYLTNKDTSTGLVMPNETLQASVGDKYRLYDIYMPQSYVDAALARLLDETGQYLDENKVPQVAYDLKIDLLHFKRMGWTLNVGDRIRVVDTGINLDAQIRITSISHPLAFPDTVYNGMEYTVEVANFVPYTTQERLLASEIRAKRDIKEVKAVNKHTKAAMDEIARAAALNQFERTYVGELAILTGALIAGNPALGATAGISGLEDLLTAIRLWSGATFEDRDSAPWRVNQAGQMWATDAFIQGVIEAVSGRIGELLITEQGYLQNRESKGGFRFDNQSTDESTTDGYKGIIAGAALAINLVMSIENRTTDGIALNVASNNDGFALSLNGRVRTRDGIGATFVQPVGGGVGLKFVDGVCVGTVSV